MNKRTCTELRPCNLMTCYSCRRLLIDTTALAMLQAGADESRVEDYRHRAINALAWEIPAPQAPAEPKAKAPKAFIGKAGVNYQAIADKLRVCGSRQYAAELLAKCTVAELDHIWTLAGRTDRIPSKFRKNDKLTHMIENLVGYRLDTRSILNAK